VLCEQRLNGCHEHRHARKRGTAIEIPNVIFVDRKVQAIEKLISVKPERTS
jgi:hypothetical protein